MTEKLYLNVCHRLA